ncbi:MAG: hypothetical protein ISP01_09970 [Methanobrevibacter arboriphilus]|uniref:Nmd3 N-terminal domain-containing protein n=1 Tax=Methanobrevibacter arboriphilus TaxID=39441 RepID=A0A843AR73_METAZ|nr:60S ribosomal export protein NMD3 [Methanobrevibacter arboriphilus]MBF4469719.1 hypothetical protein [Methanobrevibacter arboriphilus]
MFCPECGNTKSPIIEGICQNCFLKKISILKIPENIEVVVCAHCNAKFEEGKWKESEIPEEEIIYRALERSINVDSHISHEKLAIELEIIQMRGTIAECYIEAEAEIFGEIIKQSFESEVRLLRNVCPNCSKQQSGYYESVVQFRADDRELTQDEMDKTDKIVDKTLNNRFYKDKLAYLVQKTKLKEGYDYYIGSYKSGKKIADAIKEEFGGIINESPRLISQDKSTGKGLYRIWILIRLPKFKKGDFVKYNDKYWEIMNIDGKRILIQDLDTFERIPLQWKEYENIEYIKEEKNIQTTTLISKSPLNMQILDPDDYTVVDIPIINEYFNEFNIGDEVNVIKIENQLYILQTEK